jgi:hypothetical protein
MDQREIHLIRNIEETRRAMGDKIDMIANRIHNTIVGPKIAADRLIENLNHARLAMQQAPSTTDNGAHPIHQAVTETIERLKATIDLIEQVKRDPWVMLGSAVIMGYVLGTLNRGNAVPSRQGQPEVEKSYGLKQPASVALPS